MKKPVAICEDVSVIIAWMMELRAEFKELGWKFRSPVIRSRYVKNNGGETPYINMTSDDNASYMQSINNEPFLQFSVTIDYYTDTGQIVVGREPSFQRVMIEIARPNATEIIKDVIQGWMKPIEVNHGFTITEEDK